jgi:hypothetical protein
MLNELIRRLNGHGEDAESLDEAVQRLTVEQSAAHGALKELHERRREALLDDASDSVLDKLERDIAHAESRIEKLALAEPSLRERLRTARVAQETRAADKAIARYLELSEDTANKVEAADASAAVQRMFWTQNMRVLGRCGIEPLGCMLILGDGFGLQWAARTRKAVGRMRAAREQRASGQPPPAREKAAPPVQASGARTRMPHQRPKLTDSARTVSPADSAPGRHSAERVPDDLAPLEPGEARVKVLRAGYSPADNRPQCSYGQVVRMPLGLAARAEDRGALVIIEAAPEGVPPGDWHDDGKERAEFRELAHRGDAGK